MSSTHLNPRRRALKATFPTETSSHHSPSTIPAPCLPPPDTNMPLRKAATFHSPKSPPSEEIDPIINVPSLPKRSRTCPKTLEDVIAAGEKRMADLIGSFDRSLSGLEALSTDSQDTLRGEDLPVPRVVLDAHVPDIDMMDVDPKSTTGRSDRRYQPQQVRNHHTSDSGIGSTVSGTIHSNTNISTSINQEHKRGSRNRDAGDSGPSHELIPVPFNTKTTHSAITRSISSTASAGAANQHLLSEYATKQIQKHIITPILREKSLKNFHPFVHGLPRRIRQKEITCLRDLEKTLIFLAPVSRPLDLREGDLAHCYLRYLKNWSVSKTAYLKFCETSIQCIHTTVDYLSEGDQRRPSDRPYTNGYFLDLVEQIRQYAAMMAASRERQASGEEMDDNDYSPDETLELRGGLSKNGRPAELVRVKNGKTMPIGNQPVNDDKGKSPVTRQVMKRSLSEETSDDDSVTRSMARRRKSTQAVPKDVTQRCSECDKEFKRPCDLTKHEKTHSRPWKCSEMSCKYNRYGWPTEKERDRHVNDKHSTAPPLYRCHFHPCPYQSKRESNCKQHMEKAHGWIYVRSKNNGRKGKKGQSGQTPPTPQITTPQSYTSYTMDVSTPLSREPRSPYDHYGAYTGTYSVAGSTCPSEEATPYPNSRVANGTFNGFGDPFGRSDPNLNFNDLPEALGPSYPIDYSPESDSFRRSSFDAPTIPSFNTSISPQDQEPTLDNIDWSNMDHDFTSYNVQMVTPASSVNNRPLPSFAQNSSIPLHHTIQAPVPSLSPGAQGNLMLYSPHSADDIAADEGFDEFVGETGKPTADFPLYEGSHGSSSLSSAANEGMFPELSTFGGQFAPHGWSGRGTDLAQQFGMGDLMHLDDECDE